MAQHTKTSLCVLVAAEQANQASLAESNDDAILVEFRSNEFSEDESQGVLSSTTVPGLPTPDAPPVQGTLVQELVL